MHFRTKKRLKNVLFVAVCLVFLYVFGVFHHPFEKDFYNDFHYPYDGDIETFVLKLKTNQIPDVKPINSYSFYYYKDCDKKCDNVSDLRLVYLIKSSLENFERRLSIRSSWGFQRRFSDVEIRTIFVVGINNNAQMQKSLNEESQRYGDIVQANFTDSYFNNTYKTMSAFYWIVKYCPNSKFYMFIDDDFYISTKNVLRFIRHPVNYPNYIKEPAANFLNKRRISSEFQISYDIRLYAGYAFKSAPHRHLPSKWYVSLQEYPYHMWPPYVSGGAFIVSKEALIDMYYASFYTKHFKFDDIYVGLLAYKAKIEPLHCEEFNFYKKPYTKFNYEYVIASHGYDNPRELVSVWNEQKSLGNA